MAVCERCGSIQVAVARRQPIDRLIFALTSKRQFTCRRCGWRARRGWSDSELVRFERPVTGGVESGASLIALDDAMSATAKRRLERRRQRRSGSHAQASEFDLDQLDLSSHERPQAKTAVVPILRPRAARRRPVRRFRSRRRREILTTFCVTAVIMFLLAALVMVAG